MLQENSNVKLLKIKPILLFFTRKLLEFCYKHLTHQHSIPFFITGFVHVFPCSKARISLLKKNQDMNVLEQYHLSVS